MTKNAVETGIDWVLNGEAGCEWANHFATDRHGHVCFAFECSGGAAYKMTRACISEQALVCVAVRRNVTFGKCRDCGRKVGECWRFVPV